MAQVVSRWPLNTEAFLRSQDSVCVEFVVDRVALRQVFVPCHYHSTNAPDRVLFIYYGRDMNLAFDSTVK